MIKHYYYIDIDGNPTDLRTGNPEHQAIIEAAMANAEKHKKGPDIGKTVKIKHKKRDLVDGKVIESLADFVVVFEPIDLGSVEEDQ
jgi:hypothetical protein